MDKKYKNSIIVSIILLFSLSCFIWFSFVYPATQSVMAQSNNLPLQGRVIYIDPGHGGKDSGATYAKIREDVLNLELSIQLKAVLEEQGAEVYLTREEDAALGYGKGNDLYHRARMIDEINPDLFVSIHMNAAGASARGAQAFYYNKSKEGEVLAKTIQAELAKVTSTRKKATPGNYYIIRNTATLGVLVECGFISNGKEREELRSKNHQKKIAKAITAGIIEYFEKK